MTALAQEIVAGLIASQFPQWADLPISPVPSAGTDNHLFRLGDKMAVRLPKLARSAPLIEKEFRWLSALAPLPLEIPRPLGLGRADARFPFAWSVQSWIEGENAEPANITDPAVAARDLGRFVSKLQSIRTPGGPRAGPLNSHRGVALAERDALTRDAIAASADRFDRSALLAAWEKALGQPVWTGPPLWVHGDLQSGNLLAREGRLVAVIDFGLMGQGDPAVDLLAAWRYCDAPERPVFQAATGADMATWNRGRGWALSTALIAFAYYRHGLNPSLTEASARCIDQVLSDP